MDNEPESLSGTAFWVADWYVDPTAGRINREGAEVKLEPKVMTVLVCLAERAGKVVSREELDAVAWAGTVVSYDALATCIIKLRKAFGDDSKKPKVIETVSKKGYRLIATVRPADPEATNQSIAPTGLLQRFTSTRLAISAAIALLLIGLVAGILGKIFFISDDGLLTVDSDKPSLVVMPFTNLSNDPDQQYLSDGITGDITTDLSNISSLHVIARQSAFYYKDQKVKLEIIGRDLGVQYIVEGSLQKAGDRLRINVQLVDVKSGHHLWAKRFDRKLGDVFAIQDEIAQHIVDALSVTLSAYERRRLAARYTNSVDAYDLFLRAQVNVTSRVKESNTLAQEFYQDAITLDPSFARAYGGMAVSYVFDYQFGWSTASAKHLDRALRLAQKAVELDDELPEAYWALSYVYLFQKQYSQAEQAVRKAIELNPNYADGYGLLAFVSNWQGQFEKATNYIQKAMLLNPHYSFAYPWNLGLAYYNLGRYTEAVQQLQNAQSRNDLARNVRAYLAASYVRLGRIDDAVWEIEQLRFQDPNISLSFFRDRLPFKDRGHLDLFLQDLSKAGLPE